MMLVIDLLAEGYKSKKPTEWKWVTPTASEIAKQKMSTVWLGKNYAKFAYFCVI
jgi:hypothetical protein